MRRLTIISLICSLLGCAAPTPRPEGNSREDAAVAAVAALTNLGSNNPYRAASPTDQAAAATLGSSGESRSVISARCHVYFKNDPTDNAKFCRNFLFSVHGVDGQEIRTILPSDQGTFVIPANPGEKLKLRLKPKPDWKVEFTPDRWLQAGDSVNIRLTQDF